MNYTQIIAIAITVAVGLVIFPAVTDTIIAALLTAKEALETMREGLILKRKQLEQENRKGAKKMFLTAQENVFLHTAIRHEINDYPHKKETLERIREDSQAGGAKVRTMDPCKSRPIRQGEILSLLKMQSVNLHITVSRSW